MLAPKITSLLVFVFNAKLFNPLAKIIRRVNLSAPKFWGVVTLTVSAAVATALAVGMHEVLASRL